MAPTEAGQSPAERAQHSVPLTIVDGMCTTAFSVVDDSIFDGSMQTQQSEIAHLPKGQTESHEKLSAAGLGWRRHRCRWGGCDQALDHSARHRGFEQAVCHADRRELHLYSARHRGEFNYSARHRDNYSARHRGQTDGSFEQVVRHADRRGLPRMIRHGPPPCAGWYLKAWPANDQAWPARHGPRSKGSRPENCRE